MRLARLEEEKVALLMKGQKTPLCRRLICRTSQPCKGAQQLVIEEKEQVKSQQRAKV